MRMQLHLSSAGFAEVIKAPECVSAVKAAADAVAAEVASQGLQASSPGYIDDSTDITAVVNMSTTDRPRAKVTIQHPAGLAMQARHGVLTKAASAAGLEVRAKS